MPTDLQSLKICTCRSLLRQKKTNNKSHLRASVCLQSSLQEQPLTWVTHLFRVTHRRSTYVDGTASTFPLRSSTSTGALQRIQVLHFKYFQYFYFYCSARTVFTSDLDIQVLESNRDRRFTYVFCISICSWIFQGLACSV